MAAGPQPGMAPMGPPMGGPAPAGAEGGGMSPELQTAAQAIMAIQDPAELAALGQLIMKKGEELMGGQQGPPPAQGAPAGPPPMAGPPPGGMM